MFFKFLRKRQNIKRIIFILALLIVPAFIFWGVGSFRSSQATKVADINGEIVSFETYRQTYDRLREQYRRAYGNAFDEEMLKTLRLQEQALDQVVNRVLMLQEAQRLGLDREEEFMRTIERFWKGALIKLLVGRKAKEISSSTHVYEPEIEAYYQLMKKEAGGHSVEPLSKIKNEIRDTIRENKQTVAMERWVSDLRENTQVKIDKVAIKALEQESAS